MSQIQALPKDILANITPHLVSGEKVTQALLQDNKKPNIIWLVSTNQAIILHGQQEANSKPIILVYALDEIKEIDYLQKSDDIQINICSGVNTSKAVFHFEITAKKEVEKFFLEFGDLITYRYINEKGKIVVVQRALPIGDKDRHKFGRGKKLEAITKSESSENKIPTKEAPSKPEAAKPASKPENIEQKLLANIQKKAAEAQQKTVEAPKSPAVTEASKPAPQPKPEEVSHKPAETVEIKKESTVKPESISTKQPSVENKTKSDNKPQDNKEAKPVAKKEIDYGSPVFFISVTVIATAVGFFCLSFFKTISRIVTFFKKH